MKTMITGATGRLGRLIISQLAGQIPALQLSAGVRNPAAAQDLAEMGIEISLTDYDRADTLTGAFRGVTRLLLISSSHTDDAVRLQQHKRVIAEARQAGVSHILYTGFAFPRPGSEDVHSLTEREIEASCMAYTFLRNGLYTDFAAVLGLQEAIRSGQLSTPPGDWRFNSVVRTDLAEAIAAVLSDPAEHEGKRYELAAARTWNFADLAEVLSEYAGKPVVHREDTAIRHWLYAWLSTINTAATSSDLEQLMGRKPTSLKDSIAPFLQDS